MSINDFEPDGEWMFNTGAPPKDKEVNLFVEYICNDGSRGYDRIDNISFKFLQFGSDIAKYRLLKPKEITTPKSALDVQISGNHYKSKAIQPVEYISANNLNFLEGCIVKRITRWRDKPAKERFDDLHKIKHEIDLLIEMENRYKVENA